MKIFGDEYVTIVAETKEQAEEFYKENEFGDLPEGGLEVIDGSKREMWFPVDELPEKYRDEEKYPQKDWAGFYIGVEITLNEAMQYRKEEPPYVLSVSSDLL